MSDQPYIIALRKVQAGDWDAAHRMVQDINTKEAAWIHAHLHRVEGDLGNAAYWYRRAGRAECLDALEIEWRDIFDALS